jgi:hypothetical protein
MAPVKGYIKPYITLRVDIQSRQGFESPIGWTSSAGAIQEKPVIQNMRPASANPPSKIASNLKSLRSSVRLR